MADTLERLTNLLALLLEARQPLTFEQINDHIAPRYEGSPSAVRAAFERDKAALREVGVHLETSVMQGDDAGRTAYRIDRVRYELRDLRLDADEQRALQLAVAASRNADARFGLLKLGGEASEDGSLVSALPVLDALPTLQQAAASRATVTFSYRQRKRTLDPYSLLLRDGWWYVMGRDHDHQQVRTYRVDRIEDAVTVGGPDSFERPAGFDPRAVFPDDPKELGERPRSAVVRIDPPYSALVAGEFDPASVVTHDDGSVDVTVACSNLDAFRSWVFGLGPHAEVLSPADVRADVVAWLRAVAGAS
jgi:predicted DNA-binding transcriptional regulator YafY